MNAGDGLYASAGLEVDTNAHAMSGAARNGSVHSEHRNGGRSPSSRSAGGRSDVKGDADGAVNMGHGSRGSPTVHKRTHNLGLAAIAGGLLDRVVVSLSPGRPGRKIPLRTASDRVGSPLHSRHRSVSERTKLTSSPPASPPASPPGSPRLKGNDVAQSLPNSRENSVVHASVVSPKQSQSSDSSPRLRTKRRAVGQISAADSFPRAHGKSSSWSSRTNRSRVDDMVLRMNDVPVKRLQLPDHATGDEPNDEASDGTDSELEQLNVRAGLDRDTTGPLDADAQETRESMADLLPSLRAADFEPVVEADEYELKRPNGTYVEEESEDPEESEPHEDSRAPSVDNASESSWYSDDDAISSSSQFITHGDHPCVLMPQNQFKAMWDIVVILLLLYVILVLPYRVAFVDTPTIDPVEITVDCLFFVDICLTFFTAYEDESGKTVADHKRIGMRYVKSWFIPDLVATFPMYLFADDSASTLTNLARLPRLLKLFRLVRLLKLVRAYRFKNMLADLELNPNVHPGVFRVLKLSCLFLSFAHVAACMWFFVGDFYAEDPDSWVNRVWPDNDPCGNIARPVSELSVSEQYAISLYYAISTLATLGFGDITARTEAEVIFSILLMMCGSTVFAYTTATISSILGSMDLRAATIRAKMDSLRDFTTGVQLSSRLTKRVTKQMKHLWSQPIVRHTDWTTIMQQMPTELREKVAIEMHSDLVQKSAFFNMFNEESEQQFIVDIIGQMRPMDFPAGEYIAHFNDPCTEFYVIQKGRVEATSSIDPSHVYMVLEEGDSLGEVGILLTKRWESNMRAASKTSVLVCPAKLFARLLSKEIHIECVEKLVRHARSKLLKLRRARLHSKALKYSQGQMKPKTSSAHSLSGASASSGNDASPRPAPAKSDSKTALTSAFSNTSAGMGTLEEEEAPARRNRRRGGALSRSDRASEASVFEEDRITQDDGVNDGEDIDHLGDAMIQEMHTKLSTIHTSLLSIKRALR